MKRLLSTLATLHRVREATEKAVVTEFLDLTSRLTKLDDRILSLQNQVSGLLAETTHLGPLPAAEFLRRRAYCDYLEQIIDHLLESRPALCADIEAKRLELTQAVKERKIVEKLEERHRLREERAVNRRVEAELDDLHASRALLAARNR